jgi:hypothetical protein
MLTRFTLGLKNDETGLGIVNKINQLITECPKEYLYRTLFRKLDGRLELVLDVNYYKRDTEEVNLVYTNNVGVHTINILTKALGEPVYLQVNAKTEFTRQRVAPAFIPVVIPTGSIASAVEIEVEDSFEKNDFPYISDSQLSTLLPWDSWLSLLQRLSVNTQRSVYKSMCCDFTAQDCINYTKLTGEEEEAYLYSELVRPENVEFFKHMSEKDDFNFIEVEAYIKARADAAQALRKFYPEDN